mmetsp:Transcript_26469/g.57748  ORF Transcript_26469/g.57748 Transcript_26469/m.57748 type:complete len:128 (+) Transcript_26469:227-610(+)
MRQVVASPKQLALTPRLQHQQQHLQASRCGGQHLSADLPATCGSSYEKEVDSSSPARATLQLQGQFIMIPVPACKDLRLWYTYMACPCSAPLYRLGRVGMSGMPISCRHCRVSCVGVKEANTALTMQ